MTMSGSTDKVGVDRGAARFMPAPALRPARPRIHGRTMDEELSDRRLIERMARDDEGALRILFARHYDRVFRFVHRLVRIDAIAEEVTNEIFLQVWSNADRFEGRSAVTSWIFSIAHNRAISTLRKRREEPWDEDGAKEIADDDDDPEVAFQKTDKAAVMRKCMDLLPPMHREIIDLVYYHEMSIGEVSTVIDVPPATVKTRLFKARKRLGKLLEAAGVDRGWP